jgi:hypothetical protein
MPLPATKSSVLFYQARRIFYEKYPDGYLFPNGLKLEETQQATKQEVALYSPSELFEESANWVISVSSGTIAKGVARGLEEKGFRGTLVLHMGFSRSKEEMEREFRSICRFNIRVIDEGYEYKDCVDFPVPFPCNPYYDRKAWKWLVENVETLTDPIVFWNIGK